MNAEAFGAVPAPESDHILPHRLWVCTCMESELTTIEQSHLRQCVICMDVMRVCLRAPTFGAVLRELKKNRAAGESQ